MNGSLDEFDTGTGAGRADEVGWLLQEQRIKTRRAIRGLKPYQDYPEVQKEIMYHRTILKRLIQDLAEIEHGR